jgi:hypothetical protein
MQCVPKSIGVMLRITPNHRYECKAANISTAQDLAVYQVLRKQYEDEDDLS